MNGRPLIIALALSFLVSGCSAGASSARQAPAVSASPGAVGLAAADFSVRSIDGKTRQLADYKGKILVLNFWAAWCAPCRAETPDMLKAYNALKAPDVAFLGVDTTESVPTVRSFAGVQHVPYPVAVANSDLLKAFGVRFFPSTIVVDRSGIIRRFTQGGITSEELRSAVADARLGKNSIFVTPVQRKLDGMLAVQQFHFDGDPKHVRTEIARAQEHLGDAARYTVSSVVDGYSAPYDWARTQHETGLLTLAVADALERIAKSSKERSEALAMRTSAYMDLHRYADVVSLYRDKLRQSPRDVTSLTALEQAYRYLPDYDAMADMATRWAKLTPNDDSAWGELGDADKRRRHYGEAARAYARALDIQLAKAKSTPIGADGIPEITVAVTANDLGDAYATLGDTKNARHAFEIATRYAALIPVKSKFGLYHKVETDRAIDGTAGVALAHGGATAVGLTQWVGADLPGSVRSTIRYRLVVAANGGKHITLNTKGLKPGWVASFCQDNLCTPNTVTFVMPDEGVKSYEFTLVPPKLGENPGPVSVGAPDSNWVSTTEVRG